MKELNYLYDLERFGIKLGLNNIKKLCLKINNPQNNYPIIHIAGTNGKGSTAAFITQILIEAGYTVGTYTSPHLVKFNERITINNKEISDLELTKSVKKLKQTVEKEKINTTFFEFTTAIAFDYFATKKIDIAIIEVGLGGRFDATNIVNPIISVITNIDKDHTQILGNTYEKIAYEKAGIIKNKIPVICNVKKQSALKVIKQKCHKTKSDLILVNKQLRITNIKKNCFSTTGIINNNFCLGLLGKHQIQNASVAIIIAKKLTENNFIITNKNIFDGLKKTKWKGRIEIIKKNPKIIIDGAHNQAGMNTIIDFIKNEKNRKILLIGISNTHDPNQMLKNICPLFKEVIVSKGNFKPFNPKKLCKIAKKYNPNSIMFEDLNDAIDYSFKKLKKTDTMLCTGSIYLVGSFLEQLEK